MQGGKVVVPCRRCTGLRLAGEQRESDRLSSGNSELEKEFTWIMERKIRALGSERNFN